MNPEQALENLTGEQFIEWLLNQIGSQAASWPELTAIKEARPKIEKIRKFMLQRFLAAEAFLGGRGADPGFLGFAAANLSESNDPLAESALEILEKKRVEELSGKERELWIRLLKALGLADEDIKRVEPKEPIRTYTSELSDVYSNSEWQTAVGAFTAHERAGKEEFAALSEMLKNNTRLSAQDLEVLTGNNRNIVSSAHVLDKIVFDKDNKLLVWDGVLRQLSARKDLYASLLKYLQS